MRCCVMWCLIRVMSHKKGHLYGLSMFISKEWKNEEVFTINNETVSHKIVIKVTLLDLITAHALISAPP